MKPKIGIAVVRTGYIGTVRARFLYWHYGNLRRQGFTSYSAILEDIAITVFGRKSL